mmetsp:Transcript_44993/g.140672  ORF Transcript_44993/g.140672 Transcript_44993/m.140672 type:complete len:522 (-) Transcript_44993:479-2044(-)
MHEHEPLRAVAAHRLDVVDSLDGCALLGDVPQLGARERAVGGRVVNHLKVARPEAAVQSGALQQHAPERCGGGRDGGGDNLERPVALLLDLEADVVFPPQVLLVQPRGKRLVLGVRQRVVGISVSRRQQLTQSVLGCLKAVDAIGEFSRHGTRGGADSDDLWDGFVDEVFHRLLKHRVDVAAATEVDVELRDPGTHLRHRRGQRYLQHEQAGFDQHMVRPDEVLGLRDLEALISAKCHPVDGRLLQVVFLVQVQRDEQHRLGQPHFGLELGEHVRLVGLGLEDKVAEADLVVSLDEVRQLGVDVRQLADQLQGVLLDPVHLFVDLVKAGRAQALAQEERMVEDDLHRLSSAALEVGQARRGLGLEQLTQEVDGHFNVTRVPVAHVQLVVEHLPQPAAIRQHRQVLWLDVVGLVGVPERAAEDEVEEDDAKGPQVEGDARLVAAQLGPVDLARLLVCRIKQQLGHLGRAVARGGHLLAEAAADGARDVEVDELPRRVDAHGVERLEVGVDAPVLVQVAERAR